MRHQRISLACFLMVVAVGGAAASMDSAYALGSEKAASFMEQVATGRCCNQVSDQTKRAVCAKLPAARTLEQMKALKEGCYGGVGPQCGGAMILAPAQTLSSGNVRMSMSVGSIAHDTCCMNHPHGLVCHESTSDILASWPDHCACKQEWVKARLNAVSLPPRHWTVSLQSVADFRSLRRETSLQPWIPDSQRVWRASARGSLVTDEIMRNLAPGCTILDCPANDVRCRVGFYENGVRAGDSVFCASGLFVAIEDPNNDLVNNAVGAVQNIFGNVTTPRFGRCSMPAAGKTRAVPVADCAAQIQQARTRLRPGPATGVDLLPSSQAQMLAHNRGARPATGAAPALQPAQA